MTKELISVFVFFGVLVLCVVWQVVENIIFIRRLRKKNEEYKNLLKNLREKPKIITETVPLSVIEARQYIPAEQLLHLPPEEVTELEKAIPQLLEVDIGKKIVEACGVKKGYYDETDTYCFRVAVEVTGRSFKKEGENE